MICVSLTWEEERLGDALVALAHEAGLSRMAPAANIAPPGMGRERDVDAWMSALAACLQIDLEPIDCLYEDLRKTVARIAPGIVRIEVDGARRYIAVAASNRTSLTVVTPSLVRERIRFDEVIGALASEVEVEPLERVETWIEAARIAPKRRDRARRQLVDHLLSEQRVQGMWLLRPDPGTSFWQLLRCNRIPRRAMLFGAMSCLQVLMALFGWILIGRGALLGVIEPGWLYAWALTWLCAIPLQVLSSWTGGRLGIDVAALLKQRLLCGALRLDPNEIRARGSGGLLAMVSESEAIETAGLAGALGVVSATAQLVGSAAMLLAGAGGALHVALLVGWCALVMGLALRFARRRAEWTNERFALTNCLVENIIGNRTRLAQQRPDQRHLAEDRLLDRYLASSRAMDAEHDLAASLPARGWLALGLLGLVPSFVIGPSSIVSNVIAIGGILQAELAFGALLTSLFELLKATVAWKSIGRLFHAASSFEPAGLPTAALPSAAPVNGKEAQVVLDARGVVFRHRADADPVLRDCSVTLYEGDRILLEGASGAGKSTLASVLSGLKSPASGLIRLGGLDRRTVGATAWRQRVASAPQFHENHILSGTLAFNLLMGRRWPASEDDRREADEVCRRLGLGPMLDRMPSHLDQVVGETGWQLSHGERSRVFLARALLQRSQVVILDETFGALDPVTLSACIDATLARAPTLLVIAHP